MNILETAAHTHSPYLHPGGEELTRVLIEKLDLQTGHLVLEIGCGTGATAVRIAKKSHVHVIAFDFLSTMVEAAKARARQCKIPLISLLAANANSPFPFPESIFDRVYAESALALTQASFVISEISRTLRPGGKLVFNERIWKSSVSKQEAAYINTLSKKYFGIPAATLEPLNRDDWCKFLSSAGFEQITTQPVDDFIPPDHQNQLRLSRRISHFLHHLKRPKLFIRNIQFRMAGKRHKNIWGQLEAVLFSGKLGNE